MKRFIILLIIVCAVITALFFAFSPKAPTVSSSNLGYVAGTDRYFDEENPQIISARFVQPTASQPDDERYYDEYDSINIADERVNGNLTVSNSIYSLDDRICWATGCKNISDIGTATVDGNVNLDLNHLVANFITSLNWLKAETIYTEFIGGLAGSPLSIYPSDLQLGSENGKITIQDDANIEGAGNFKAGSFHATNYYGTNYFVNGLSLTSNAEGEGANIIGLWSDNRLDSNTVQEGIIELANEQLIPILWWALDGNTATAEDLSENNNDGVIVGENRVNGKFARGLDFNGSGARVYKTTPSDFPTGLNAFTFSLWAKPRTVSNGDTILNYGLNDTQKSVHFIFRGNNLCFDYYGAGSIACIGEIPLNEWTFITGTYDGSKMRIYKNGNYKNVSSTIGLNLSNTVFEVGGLQAESLFFDGSVDDIKVFDKKLSDRQISELYRAGTISNGGAIDGNFILDGNIIEPQDLYIVAGSKAGCPDGWSFPSDTQTQIDWFYSYYDIGGDMNLDTNSFVVSYAGWYEYDVSVMFADGESYKEISVQKNETGYFDAIGGTTPHNILRLHGWVELAEGDRVRVRVYEDSSGGNYLVELGTYFKMFWAGRTK